MSKLANFSHEIQQKRTDEKLIKEEFLKPLSDNIFFLNKRGMILNENTRFIKFDKNEWSRNVKKFCIDTYGVPDVYLIVLLLNEISSQFGFVRERFPNTNIITPTMETIITTLSYRT